MKKKLLIPLASVVVLLFVYSSCTKESTDEFKKVTLTEEMSANHSANCGQNYNLEVVLRGEGRSSGHIHFRQDRDEAKIIELGVKVHHLQPNHEYKLQRAVDAINVVDGNCTSTTWLTLGYGLDPGSINTDNRGDGKADLWRDVTAVASGSQFDIHFQVIDAVTLAVVLTSDCYQYTVR